MPAIHHGWWVVAGLFLILNVSSGFGFHNHSVHLNALSADGDLHKLFAQRGAHRRTRKTVSRLRKVRNELAHHRYVPYSTALDLIACSPS